MLIEVGNLNARVPAASALEQDWLRDYLSFDDEKARFIKHRTGDGKIRMYSEMTRIFPAGFVSMVCEAARREGYLVEILDKRKCPAQRDTQADIAWLRDYQLTAVDKVCERARGILWLPTGSGKTEIFAALTQALPCRWLFLVHRTTLVEQAAERLHLRTGTTAGFVGEGQWNVGEQVTVAMFQTVSKALNSPKSTEKQKAKDLLQWAQGLCVDEAHTQPSATYWQVSQSTSNAYFRVGLSGTPLARGDKRSVLAVAALGPVIYRIKPELLIERGILAKPKIYMMPVYQESDKPTWQGVYGECVVRSKTRNQAIVQAVKQADKPCLVFVKEVRHGIELDKALSKAGLQTSFVYGSHSTDWRQAHIKRLVSGGLDVLICSVIFQEGVDIPSLRSVVIATGGKSVIAALQRIGRGMRMDKDKTTFEVWDIADKGCSWLEKHTRGRLKAYLADGHEVVEVPPPVHGVAS